jgi:predicted permease
MQASQRSTETVPARRGGVYKDLKGDIVHALRQYRRTPGFTAVALLTIALGIGVNAAMFSIVNGVLLRPLPYPAAEELVLLYHASPRTEELEGRLSLEDMQDWRARTRTLRAIAGFAPVPTILTGREEAVELEMTYVTEQFFDVLGTRPQLGRPLLADDHRQQQRNAVISDRMWRTVFGADASVLGSTMQLRGEPFTVVGVMPGTVRHPTPDADVWVPQSLVGPNMFSNGMPTRGDRYMGVIGRLAAGADAAAAERELTALSAELAATYPESNEDWVAATVVPLHRSVTGDVDTALLLVLGVVGFILLIACANLANLMLARSSARTREIAVRTALGASRGRILRQLLTESLVLALVGGILGLLLSYWGVQTILAWSAETLPRVEDVRLDLRVISFGTFLAVLTGLLFGVAPALRMARVDPQNDLRGGRGTVGADGGRLRRALVVAEVALAVLLVVGATLMARSFLALRTVDAGFRPDRVLTVTMQLNLAGVPEGEIGQFLVQRREEILTRVRALPGVQAAGMTNVFPLRDQVFTVEYRRAGATPDETGVQADTRYVDPAYLSTMGVPLLRGEPLPTQLTGEPVPVVLSESAARRLWPDDDAVGRRISVPWGEATVVGVVGDVRQVGLADEPQPAIYFPQVIAPRLMATLVVRSTGEPMALAAPIRDIVREIDPNQPIRSVETLRSLMAESVGQERFFTILFAVFGSLALVLAAVGIYGVLAYTVRQRTQEIGVRMALGARTVDVMLMVGGGGMKLVVAGLAIGTVAAALLSRVLASLLYGVSPTDPGAYAAAVAFLLLTGVAAIFVPARRAMHVEPMTALRPE